MSKKVLFSVVVAVVVIAGVATVLASQKNSKQTTNPPDGGVTMDDGTVIYEKDRPKSTNPATCPLDAKVCPDGSSVGRTGPNCTFAECPEGRPSSGSYKESSVSDLTQEFRAGNKVVIFFYAPWCPFCKAADQAFRSRTNEIPAGVTVIKADYDSEIELKQKYGVTYQHTFVQVNAQGNMITKWNGGDIENLKKYLQ